MEFSGDQVFFGSFFSITLGIIVLFIGKRLNSRFKLLKELSIPEPVSGGLFISGLITLFFLVTQIEINFNLKARDLLLVYFFTTIGINASIADLFKGGKPLALLLLVTAAYIVVQNMIGVSIASLLGLGAPIGMLGGSMSLIGGHGTAIAWAPRISSEYGITNGVEIGMACATFGLILASIMGGPIARFLIKRHQLQPSSSEPLDIGLPDNNQNQNIGYLDFLDAVLAIHLCIVLGLLMNSGLKSLGIELPMFLTCLFAGIIMTNLVPRSIPRITGTEWPSRKPAMALIADISLGTFLAMSLMSMQLWVLADLAGPLMAILAGQLIMVILITLFVVFPLMGRNYDAAVVCAGFSGFALGATPTAMANMSAVSQRYGASHLAFIIVPLVSAFFIDIANAILISLFLTWI